MLCYVFYLARALTGQFDHLSVAEELSTGSETRISLEYHVCQLRASKQCDSHLDFELDLPQSYLGKGSRK